MKREPRAAIKAGYEEAVTGEHLRWCTRCGMLWSPGKKDVWGTIHKSGCFCTAQIGDQYLAKFPAAGEAAFKLGGPDALWAIEQRLWKAHNRAKEYAHRKRVRSRKKTP